MLNMCLCGNERQPHTGPHQQKHNQLVEGGDYFLLYGTDEATSRKPSTNEMLQNWRDPSGDPQDGPGHGDQERLQELGLLSLETRRPKGLLAPVSLHAEVVKTQ